MPPVRISEGRASKACDACRTRKTRCYESGNSRACLRCTTLGLACSLDNVDPVPNSASHNSGHSCARVEQRVAQLEQTVLQLKSVIAESQPLQASILTTPDSEGEERFSRRFREQEAPLVVIQDAASDTVLEPAPPTPDTSLRLNIIANGIITELEANDVLNIFQRHYGRWIGLDESGPPQIQVGNVKSPLLLCACCLIAVRHSEIDRALILANQLFLNAKALLGEDMLHAQHTIEFFQAVLVLSLWSTTLGQRLMSIDSWLISGFALQHGSVSAAFQPRRATSFEKGIHVWAHLCLAHMHSCVAMRRKTMIAKNDVEKARQSLSHENATNFEHRMVAELCLYWIIYEQCVATSVNVPRARAALQTWKEEWAFLFAQPRRQFLQMSFFFAGLLTYEQSLSSKSAAVRESVVSEMVHLSSDILNLSIEKGDARTRHLTDHVYHVVTFAAVTLCRLLYRYETQLSSKFDLKEKDALVSRTIRWLCEIDRSPHIGKVMSSLISNVQKKLRPEAQELAQSELETQQQRNDHDIDAIPDFLAMDDYLDFDWDGMVPDWQSLASDDFMNPIST